MTPSTRDLPRRIGFWGASAVGVGVMIGSGIFRQPPEIANQLGSPAVILLLWLLGGILSLFGGFTYAELATMYPQSGGIYVFLREGLGRPVAFIFGWTYMLITKPFAAAGIAVIFGEHILLLADIDVPDPHRRAIVVNTMVTVILALLTAINAMGVSQSTGLAKILTSLKVLALVAIIGIALALRKGGAVNLHAFPAPKPFLAALAPVMLAILWTYDGWSDVGAIAGEVESPRKQLPRIYLVGTAAVTLIYVAINAVYMWLVPLPEMRGSSTVAPLVMDRLIGPAGGIAVTIIIIVSTLGSTHSSILTGARVTFAQARDGLLFRFLARVHPARQTPAIALGFQLLMSCLALWHTVLLNPVGPDGKPAASAFSRLADGFTFTMWIFYGLAGLAIFILRVRRPDAPRPYRCWGYPVVPALFVLAAGAMTYLCIRSDIANPDSRGMQTLPWLGILALGLPTYYLWRCFNRNAEQDSTAETRRTQRRIGENE